MLSHERIWEGIDALAERYGLSVSALARRAGLDPTAFNRSKRVAPDGRRRWPSTESIAKILQATGTDLEEFNRLVAGTEQKALPSADRFGDAWRALPGFWEEAPARLPPASDPSEAGRRAFAVTLRSPLLSGLYRAGDTLLVTRVEAVSPGDRLLLLMSEGDMLAVEVESADRKSIVVRGKDRIRIDRSEIATLTRILWASQ